VRLGTRRLKIEQGIADADRLPAARVDDREALTVRDDDRRDQALRTAREDIEIEVEERLTATYARTGGHQHFETLAAESNGIDAHMQENLSAVRGAQRDRVPRRRD
jgi:hypothetical protein